MDKSVISFQIDRCWFSTYMKISNIQTDIPFEFKETEFSGEFPVQYTLSCKKDDSKNIILNLKRISTISHINKN